MMPQPTAVSLPFPCLFYQDLARKSGPLNLGAPVLEWG